MSDSQPALERYRCYRFNCATNIDQRIQISPVKNFGRIQHSAPVQTQQPKTKPDDAFKILGCCETLRDNKTYRRGSQRNDDIEAMIAQEKKLSNRQKLDTQISRQQSR